MGKLIYRTAQPSVLATFPSWGDLRGAGRKGLPDNKGIEKILFFKCNEE